MTMLASFFCSPSALHDGGDDLNYTLHDWLGNSRFMGPGGLVGFPSPGLRKVFAKHSRISTTHRPHDYPLKESRFRIGAFWSEVAFDDQRQLLLKHDDISVESSHLLWVTGCQFPLDCSKQSINILNCSAGFVTLQARL